MPPHGCSCNTPSVQTVAEEKIATIMGEEKGRKKREERWKRKRENREKEGKKKRVRKKREWMKTVKEDKGWNEKGRKCKGRK